MDFSRNDTTPSSSSSSITSKNGNTQNKSNKNLSNNTNSTKSGFNFVKNMSSSSINALRHHHTLNNGGDYLEKDQISDINSDDECSEEDSDVDIIGDEKDFMT
jgi:hypothetical protein